MMFCLIPASEDSSGDPEWMGYTISFYANGGSGTMDPLYASGWYTLPECGFEPPEGKEFWCWTDINHNHYKPGQGLGLESDNMFTAWWLTPNTYAVYFDRNGGYGTMNDALDVSGEYTLPECTFTAPSGKIFSCWQIGDDRYYPGDKIDVQAETVAKAVWKDTPAPEPVPTHDPDNNYTNTITADTDTYLTETFTDAKAGNGTVDIIIGGMDIKFDTDAVSSIGDRTVSMKANLKNDDPSIEGAKAVIDVTLDGATFTNGTATVNIPFTVEIPSGKVVKVYLIEGEEKTEVAGATYQDEKVTFTTNRFSTYAVMFDDAPPSSDGGFPWWIVGVVAAVVVIAAVGAFFFLRKH